MEPTLAVAEAQAGAQRGRHLVAEPLLVDLADIGARQVVDMFDAFGPLELRYSE
jgi:hypothetical protein